MSTSLLTVLVLLLIFYGIRVFVDSFFVFVDIVLVDFFLFLIFMRRTIILGFLAVLVDIFDVVLLFFFCLYYFVTFYFLLLVW